MEFVFDVPINEVIDGTQSKWNHNQYLIRRTNSITSWRRVTIDEATYPSTGLKEKKRKEMKSKDAFIRGNKEGGCRARGTRPSLHILLQTVRNYTSVQGLFWRSLKYCASGGIKFSPFLWIQGWIVRRSLRPWISMPEVAIGARAPRVALFNLHCLSRYIVRAEGVTGLAIINDLYHSYTERHSPHFRSAARPRLHLDSWE